MCVVSLFPLYIAIVDRFCLAVLRPCLNSVAKVVIVFWWITVGCTDKGNFSVLFDHFFLRLAALHLSSILTILLPSLIIMLNSSVVCVMRSSPPYCILSIPSAFSNIWVGSLHSHSSFICVTFWFYPCSSVMMVFCMFCSSSSNKYFHSSVF